jgi:8-oxo-dGTP pyrophosphatase MutT (NUDIX family)
MSNPFIASAAEPQELERFHSPFIDGWFKRDLGADGLVLPQLPGTPYGSLLAARAVLALEVHPWEVVMRRGEKGEFGFVGGTIPPWEDAAAVVRREVSEEAEVQLASELRFLSVIETPHRTVRRFRVEVEVPCRRFPALTVELSALDWTRLEEPRAEDTAHGSKLLALGTLERDAVWLPKDALPSGFARRYQLPKRREKVNLSSPYALMYAALVREGPACEKIEGRDVVVLDLTKPSHLIQIRAAHRPLAAWWAKDGMRWYCGS